MTTVAPPDLEGNWPIAHCQSRSCQAEIIWARTELGSRMPVDAQPHPAGTVLLEGDGEVPTARVLKKGEREGRDDLRHSHFVTCTEPGNFRRRQHEKARIAAGGPTA